MLKRVRRLPSLAGKGLRRAAPVLGALLLLAAGAYAVKTQLLDDDDDTAPAARLSVQVLPPGTFAAAHPYAPYYVVPRKRFAGPSKLTRVARNNLVTKPESALAKGAMAGSPQIVRLVLRATSAETVTVDGVRAKVVSDARPLRGWYTASLGCKYEPVRRAKINLEAKRGVVHYVDAEKHASSQLAFQVDRTIPQVLELQATARRHRIAWVAELSVRDKQGHPATITVDNGGEPFRVTSASDSRAYRPIYGRSGIIGYARQQPGFGRC